MHHSQPCTVMQHIRDTWLDRFLSNCRRQVVVGRYVCPVMKGQPQPGCRRLGGCRAAQVLIQHSKGVAEGCTVPSLGDDVLLHWCIWLDLTCIVCTSAYRLPWPRQDSLLKRQAHRPVPINIFLLGVWPPAKSSQTVMPWGVLTGEATCEDCSGDDIRGALTPEVLLQAQQRMS